MGRRERQQAGFERAKRRGEDGNAEMAAFMKKGEEAGRPGKPKLTRADVKRAKRIQNG